MLIFTGFSLKKNILTLIAGGITIKAEKNLGNEMVHEINDVDFENKVLKSQQPVLVDMWAPWCVPCRMVAPVVEKLSGKYQGKMHFYKMNIDENPKTPSSFRVMSIPTLLLFKNGKAVDMVVGAVPERTLTSHIDAVL